MKEVYYELIILKKSESQQYDQHIPQSGLALKFPTVHMQYDNQEIVFTESSAICDFFAERSKQFIVTSEHIKIRSNYLFWKNYADASFMPNLALKQIFGQIAEHTPLPFRWVSILFKTAFNAGYLNEAVDQQLNRINTHLAENNWLAGDIFTIADILLWFPLQACARAHAHIEKYPAILNYIQHIQDRPAFQKSLKKGQWNDTIFNHYWKKAW